MIDNAACLIDYNSVREPFLKLYTLMMLVFEQVMISPCSEIVSPVTLS